MKELDRLLADLKRHFARGVGLTYGEVVMLDDVVSALDQVQIVQVVQAAETYDLAAELPPQFDWFGHSGRPSTSRQ